MSERVTIVGGGLAGLTLGIGLRQRGVQATVWEAGGYPRHRVCGEFISGDGQSSLARLGLLDGLRQEGSCSASNVSFFTGAAQVAKWPLPKAALCISRTVLDDWLATEFRRLGGELRLGARWVSECGVGVVRAAGRRAEPVSEGWRLFGLKVHARGVRLNSDLEIHFVPSGYVGLCRLADGDVNICGLFRSRVTVPDLAQRWRDWLGGSPGSVLRSRLAVAECDEDSFCSVAGLSLRPQRALDRNECCVGDALTMIPPVTGNGMSMAFESAELAIEPLTRFSCGELSWVQARREIARSCDDQFSSRLRWASWVQRGLFQSRTRSGLLFFASRSEWFWRWLFDRTR